MFPRLRSFLLPIICLFAPPLSNGGQESPDTEWRRFQNKDGNEIEARPVSLSSDLRTVQILRRDGRTFELSVTRLSLDDQQFLRDWFLLKNPVAPNQLRFEISLDQQEKALGREKLVSSLREVLWETREISYQVEITSLSTASVPNLRLEYVLLMEDFVEKREPKESADSGLAPDSDEETPRWRTRTDGEIRYCSGTASLPPLVFNRACVLNVGTQILDTLKASGIDRDEARDLPAGIIVRLIDGSGTVLSEHSDLTRSLASLNWENFASRRDPREENGEGVLVSSIAAK